MGPLAVATLPAVEGGQREPRPEEVGEEGARVLDGESPPKLGSLVVGERVGRLVAVEQLTV